MRIMVCYDGSEAAHAAIRAATKLAEAAAAEVHLVRVSPHRFTVEGSAWGGSLAVDVEKHERAAREDEALRAELEELARGFRTPTQVAVISGTRIADELIRYARGAQVDLIVLGCHDRGPLHGGVGGETTVRIARSKVAPVLLGPMVPMAHVDLRAVPAGCPVFSRDGAYVGQVAGVAHDRIRVVHGDQEQWFALEDIAEISMASGLHLDMDAADVAGRRVGPPTGTAPSRA
ncbi:MAG: hypothetical protein Kow0010_04840 [Dehalococcoidia bacterium]